MVCEVNACHPKQNFIKPIITNLVAAEVQDVQWHSTPIEKNVLTLIF